MVLYQTSRLTAAADITLSKSGMYLTHVRVYAGATPGTLGWLYDGVASAHFPAPSNATRGHKTYKVSYLVQGTTIPSAVLTFNGGLSVAELQFADATPTGHPDMTSYRALRFARTDVGAVTGDITANFTGGNQAPRGVVCHISASAGRVRFPSISGLRESVEAVISDTWCETLPAPTLTPTQSLTLEGVTDGAATIQAIVYY